jgi:hypothetical protein
MLELQDGAGTNSQARVQDESTYKTKEKGWLMQVEFFLYITYYKFNIVHCDGLIRIEKVSTLLSCIYV